MDCRKPSTKKGPPWELYSFLHHGLQGRGYGLLLWGTDSALPGSFSESSLGLGTCWNLSRTDGVKVEAFTGRDGVSSVLGESLQAEVLCRRQPRHVHEVGHQHTGLRYTRQTPRLWDGSQYISTSRNLTHRCLFKAAHCSNVVIVKTCKQFTRPSGTKIQPSSGLLCSCLRNEVGVYIPIRRTNGTVTEKSKLLRSTCNMILLWLKINLCVCVCISGLGQNQKKNQSKILIARY